jgi:cell division protein FtsB
MTECKAAFRWSIAAFVVALIAIVYSTWYLPGLIAVLNKLAAQVEKQNARSY